MKALTVYFIRHQLVITLTVQYYLDKMAYNFETGSFDSSNHELLPAQMNGELRDMQPGDIAYCDMDQLFPDKESRLWINNSADIWTYEEVEEDISNFDMNFVRVICISEGIIVDASHYDHYSYSEIEERFNRTSLELVRTDKDDDFEPLPVIYYAGNKEELKMIEPALAETNNIVLDGSELDPIVNEFVAYGLEDDEEDDS